MMRMSFKAMALAGTFLAAVSVQASAGNIPFSGSGGGPGTLAGANETWVYDADGGFFGDNFGSPGVGNNTTTYDGDGVHAAIGFTITFTGSLGGIDTASAGVDCGGGSFGGTVFCSSAQWTLTTLTDDTATFMAAGPSDYLAIGDSYFADIFFTGASGSSLPTGFSGSWIYADASVPEPASLGLIGIGMAGLGLMRRRRRS